MIDLFYGFPSNILVLNFVFFDNTAIYSTSGAADRAAGDAEEPLRALGAAELGFGTVECIWEWGEPRAAEG